MLNIEEIKAREQAAGMRKLIDARKLWDAVNAIGGCGAERGSWADGWDKAIDECIRLIEEAPAVVRPVKVRRKIQVYGKFERKGQA